MNRISSKIISLLCENNILERDKQELYTYALEILFQSILHFSTAVIIGCVFCMALESFLMFLSFSLVRRFAGGLHAKTPLRCYFTSIAAILSMLFLIWIFTKWENDVAYYIILFISNLTIWIASPIESSNKPLSYKEKKIFKGVSIALSSIITVIAVMIYELVAVNVGVSLSFGLVLTALVLNSTLIQNMLASKQKNTKSNQVKERTNKL